MKIKPDVLMKLLVLYFDHSPKINENIEYHSDDMKNYTKNFIFGYVPINDGIYWYIIDMRNFSGFIFKQDDVCFQGLDSIKNLCRFIRMFRNEFIGSPYKGEHKAQYWEEDDE